MSTFAASAVLYSGKFASFAKVTNYDAAAVIHQLNDPLTSICFILRGRLKAVRGLARR